MPDDAPWWTDDDPTADLPSGVNPQIDRPTVPGPWDADPTAYWWGRGEAAPGQPATVSATSEAAAAVAPVAATAVAATATEAPPTSTAEPPTEPSTAEPAAHGTAEPPTDDAGRRRRARIFAIIGVLTLLGYIAITFAAPLIEERQENFVYSEGINFFLGSADGQYAAFLNFEDNVGAWLLLAVGATIVAAIAGALTLRSRGLVVVLFLATAGALGLYVLIMRPPGSGDSITWIPSVGATIFAQLAVVLLVIGLTLLFVAILVRWPGGAMRTMAVIGGVAVVATGVYIVTNTYTTGDVANAEAARIDGFSRMTLAECDSDAPLDRSDLDATAILYLGGDIATDTRVPPFDFETDDLRDAMSYVESARRFDLEIDGQPLDLRFARPRCPSDGSAIGEAIDEPIVVIDWLTDRDHFPIGSSEYADTTFLYVGGEFVVADVMRYFDAEDLAFNLRRLADSVGMTIEWNG